VCALEDEAVTEQISMTENLSTKQWLFIAMECILDAFAEVAVTVWAIWYVKQKIFHGGEFQSPL
jgi:hypothetical protein